MKKNFDKPEYEILRFETPDVIATSSCPADEEENKCFNNLNGGGGGNDPLNTKLMPL